jgi:hypothetical protein
MTGVSQFWKLWLLHKFSPSQQLAACWMHLGPLGIEQTAWSRVLYGPTHSEGLSMGFENNEIMSEEQKKDLNNIMKNFPKTPEQSAERFPGNPLFLSKFKADEMKIFVELSGNIYCTQL